MIIRWLMATSILPPLKKGITESGGAEGTRNEADRHIASSARDELALFHSASYMAREVGSNVTW